LNNILLFSIADPYLNGFKGTWKFKIKMIVDVLFSPALLSILLGIVVGLVPGWNVVFTLQLPILNMIPYLITVLANGALPCINLVMGCNILFNVIAKYKA
jgi:predicted permease